MVSFEHNLGHCSRVTLDARRNQFFINKRGKPVTRHMTQVLFYPRLTVLTHIFLGNKRIVSMVTSLVEPGAILLRELG